MPTKKKPLRLSTGPLQGISPRQLAKLKAEVCAAVESRWRRDNEPSTRSRGRPSLKDHVFEACKRTQRGMARRKKTTLHEWYRTIEGDLRARGIELSVPTRKKFIREWMSAHLSIDRLPEGIGPFLINTNHDYTTIRWIVLWGGLCQQFPEVQPWLKQYKLQHGLDLRALPHEILPPALQDKINNRSDFPLGPRLYDHLVRGSLRNVSDK